ncbi:putative PDZ/DHR/GLGF domain protein [uncultured Desulfobacterium sp.]|uniref:Putative PDZ/DHR/GLGF domain protein n=1 Tax=uncultured Desulfobacterium sp. TaxID=201089 RepID=A0A445MSQ3_9BACT|nr:putative PDZ/DHR/GLGF domain protein [uncultured Desulfobacterium sp.]
MTKIYYTIFNIIAFALIVYTGVDIFFNITRSRVAQESTNGAATNHSPEAGQNNRRSLSDFDIVTERNLFGSQEKASSELKAEELENIAMTTLKVTLLGTVSGDQQSSRAVIEDSTKKTQALYKVGDSIQDAVIKMILRGKVVLRIGDKDEMLAMPEPSSTEEYKGPFIPGQMPGPMSGPAAGRMPGGMFQQGPEMASTITINRAELAEPANDLNQVLANVRIQPHFKNGKTDGLAISSIRRGGIFSKLGLRNGDILQNVNGNALASPDDILSLYESLKTGDQASIQIIRMGRQKTMNYTLR